MRRGWSLYGSLAPLCPVKGITIRKGAVDTVPGGGVLLEVVFEAKVECVPEKWSYVGVEMYVIATPVHCPAVRKSSMS